MMAVVSRYNHIAKNQTTVDDVRGRFLGAKPNKASWEERNGGRPPLEPDPRYLRRRKMGKPPSPEVTQRRQETAVRLEAWCATRGNTEFSVAEAAQACGATDQKRGVREEDVRWVVHGGQYERIGYAGWRRREK